MQVVGSNGHDGLRARTREVPEPIAPTPASPLEFPLVMVEWWDPWFDIDQFSPEDFRPNYPVRTVGFLLREARAPCRSPRRSFPTARGSVP